MEAAAIYGISSCVGTEPSVTIQPCTAEWIQSGEIKNANTERLFAEINIVTDNVLETVGCCLSSNQAIIDSTKSLLHVEDNTLQKKREVIRKFIKTSYPYWDKVDASNPVQSLETIINIIKKHPKCESYGIIFNYLTTMVHNISNQEKLNKVCHDMQRLIAYAISYVHNKRRPTTLKDRNEQEVLMYQAKYCEYVDVAKWAKRYAIPL